MEVGRDWVDYGEQLLLAIFCCLFCSFVVLYITTNMTVRLQYSIRKIMFGYTESGTNEVNKERECDEKEGRYDTRGNASSD